MVEGVPGGHPTVQSYTGIAVFTSVDAVGLISEGKAFTSAHMVTAEELTGHHSVYQVCTRCFGIAI